MSPSSKKQGGQNWKCLGLYVTRQLICRQLPKLFITYSSLKLKHSPSIKHNKDWNKINMHLHSNSHRNDTNRILYQTFCVLWDICHDLLCVFGDFFTSGTLDSDWGNKITVTLLHVWPHIQNTNIWPVKAL